MRAKDQLLAAAAQSPVLQDVYVEGLSPAPQVELVVDREKAAALGSPSRKSTTSSRPISAPLTSMTFPIAGACSRSSCRPTGYPHAARSNPDLQRAQHKRSARADVVVRDGALVAGTVTDRRFQLLSFGAFFGRGQGRRDQGDAIREMERIAGRPPKGFGYEWAGQSLQEKLSGSQAPFRLMLSVLLVFLVLAALYESWTIPLSVLLTVPLGILGAVAAAMLRGMIDVYFTVGIVTIIGLAAKDGILIIEFAKALREQGRSIRDATIEACRMRFRPIVMTGLAFVFALCR